MNDAPHFSKSSKQSLVIFAIMLSISGCAAVETVLDDLGIAEKLKKTYTPIIDKSFTARDQAAQKSDLDDAALIQKGYMKIGRLEVSRKVEECWSGESGCESVSSLIQAGSPTQALYEEAAAKGADFVQLVAEGKETREPISKNGRCTRYETGTVMVSVPNNEYVCDSRGCRTEYKGTKLVERTGKVCAERERISGQGIFHQSIGILWRHEPELAKAEIQKIKSEGPRVALLEALESGNRNRVKQVLESIDKELIADVINGTSKDGRSPLHLAYRKTDKAIVPLLLQYGASIYADPYWSERGCSKKGKAPLLISAVRSGDRKSVAMLIDGTQGDSAQKPRLLAMATNIAVLKNDHRMVQLLLSKGANPNTPVITFNCGNEKILKERDQIWSPLLLAIVRNDYAMARTLLAKGEFPTEGPHPLLAWLETPKKSRDKKILDLMLSKGIDVNSSSYYPNDLWLRLVVASDLSALNTFLDVGADPAKYYYHPLPLLVESDHCKIEAKCIPTLQRLIKGQSAEFINAAIPTRFGRETALDMAVRLKKNEIAKILRENGGKN